MYVHVCTCGPKVVKSNVVCTSGLLTLKQIIFVLRIIIINSMLFCKYAFCSSHSFINDYFIFLPQMCVPCLQTFTISNDQEVVQSALKRRCDTANTTV